MKQYRITVSSNNTQTREFISTSRNAKKHLNDCIGGQGGAVCTVKNMHGVKISECRYSSEFGFYYCTL